MTQPHPEASQHAFVRRPHATLVSLSLPVMLSLIAEPLTGAVDTAFVARLGSGPLAALAVATALLSSVLWMFNFLAIGAQTEVAQSAGARGALRAQESAALALALAAVLGTGLAVVSWPLLPAAAEFMTRDAEVRRAAVVYLEIRLLGAPAVLVALAGFGVLRGLQDMRTPLVIAVVSNGLNALLDPLLIFGPGPVPALGVAGAAWASVAAQWLAAGYSLAAVQQRLGLPRRVPWRDAGSLLAVGRDLFARTALLLTFLLLATRAATRIDADSGAAHQAIRQIWLLGALALDAYAATAQSLVAYFLGAGRVDLARRAARVACGWGLATGAALALAMLAGEELVARALVPPSARGVFAGAWAAAALAQPLNALSFVTDGIHWGTRDYRYLRNAMLAATALGLLLLWAVSGGDGGARGGLRGIWIVTAVWIGVRSGFGLLRVWPGLGAAPLRGGAGDRAGSPPA